MGLRSDITLLSAGKVSEAPTDGKAYVRKDGGWIEVPVTTLPVGSIFLTIGDTNPATFLGYGTWVRRAINLPLYGAT